MVTQVTLIWPNHRVIDIYTREVEIQNLKWRCSAHTWPDASIFSSTLTCTHCEFCRGNCCRLDARQPVDIKVSDFFSQDTATTFVISWAVWKVIHLNILLIRYFYYHTDRSITNSISCWETLLLHVWWLKWKSSLWFWLVEDVLVDYVDTNGSRFSSPRGNFFTNLLIKHQL